MDLESESKSLVLGHQSAQNDMCDTDSTVYYDDQEDEEQDNFVVVSTLVSLLFAPCGQPSKSYPTVRFL